MVLAETFCYCLQEKEKEIVVLLFLIGTPSFHDILD